MKQEPQIQSSVYRKFSSSIKSITVNLANFRYNHKDDPENQDIYINREQLENKLESWLLHPGKSGSYLVAGYRGMGKTSLVNHVLNRITRQYSSSMERLASFSVLSIILTAFCLSVGNLWFSTLFFAVSVISSFFVIYDYYATVRHLEDKINKFSHSAAFKSPRVKKLLSRQDNSNKSYQRIKIKVNLGREVMNERDVLCLITNSIRIRYEEYLRIGQNKPFWLYLQTIVCCFLTSISVKYIVLPLLSTLNKVIEPGNSMILRIWNFIVTSINSLSVYGFIRIVGLALIYVCCLLLIYRLFKFAISFFDQSEKCLKQLQNLYERISSHVSESDGDLSLSNSMVYVSLFSRRKRNYQIANIRDIETELTEIINTINSKKCFLFNRIQFLIVLDELDKVEYHAEREEDKSKTQTESTPPDFSTAIEGFSGSMTNSDKRRTIMQLLANMKLFLTSARAKFIFISGRELYEAFLADVSDREYAISSIFSGVINVNSFLQSEREQSDISSLTEQLVSETLLPKEYLWGKTEDNALKNKVLKREIPSFRWYIQYLTELAEKDLHGDELQERKAEIRHIIMFLRCFTVYLSHVSNGSPKKIILYFEKYVKRTSDIIRLYDWNDTLEAGVLDEKGYVLHFTPADQQKIGFIFHRMAPIMDVIINNVSNYDDKLLISASFLIDHLFKFHGRGFSWRNIEQTPELLDVNKTSELRNFITSIIDFMQQNHLTSIMVGLFQFKFRRRISEEIAHLSRISDEAAAIFNFTLNETQAVKQHNSRLLAYYMTLRGQASSLEKQKLYNSTIARLHITLGDLYFQEEDYYRALQEYRNGLSYLNLNIEGHGIEEPSSIITRIRTMLKMGLTCEYCKTYETAYVIYCDLVDAMISVREINERLLGLDIIDKYTDDWRIKLPMVVDPGVRAEDDKRRNLRLKMSEKQESLYRRHIVYDLWDDGVYKYENNKKEIRSPHELVYAPAEYSLDFDQLVSGFAHNLSPEKSHFISHLSMFEDVRLIYKAILAKLFILEKMNMSGITKSNIEVAEAEFRYLHRTINLKEKFFISADFFNQLGKILYYKNSLGLLQGMSIEKTGERREISGKESLPSALHWWGIDLYAYIDDFCFNIAKSNTTKFENRDAVLIKKGIKEFLSKIIINDIPASCESNPNKPATKEKNIGDLLTDVKQKIDENGVQNTILQEYINYLSIRLDYVKDIPFEKIRKCSEHRCTVRKKGWNLPCYACKYYNQSLHIMMEQMFVPISEEPQAYNKEKSKSIYLLKYSFRKFLRNTRVNHLRLLAMNIVSLGNTIYSCASDRKLHSETLKLVCQFLDDGKDTEKEKYIEGYIENVTEMHKLDKVILYYLAAYRFYNIARQYRDAGDCLFKIVNLLDEVVASLNFDKKDIARYEQNPEQKDYYDRLKEEIKLWQNWSKFLFREKEDEHSDKRGSAAENKKQVLELLFTRYAKAIGQQYGYSAIPELHEYRWAFHMNNIEDLNFTRLQTYSELKEIIWLITDTKIKNFDISAYFANEKWDTSELYYKSDIDFEERGREEAEMAYKHFQPLGKLRDTFYNEIVDRYARFKINERIMRDMFGRDSFVNPDNSHEYDKDFESIFLQCLERYLNSSLDKKRLDYRIFKTQETSAERMKLVEFLLNDSIVCLTEIIYALSPKNHITSFTSSFIAQVYNQLWEQSKMYETLVTLYNYHQYSSRINTSTIFELWGKQKLEALMKSCSKHIDDDLDLEARYGSLCSRLSMTLRHKIDDRTIHHVISNYAAEMAIQYYVAAEGLHSEGNSYKSQISRNYVLNDDLDDDIWLFNTAMERFRLHTMYIQEHKRRLVDRCKDSRLYKYNEYMSQGNYEPEFAKEFDTVRFDDSLHTNSEL